MMNEVGAGPSELFRAAQEHVADTTLGVTAIAVALSELVRVGYSIDNNLSRIADALESDEPWPVEVRRCR